jgi:hypothetical protein
MLRIELVTYNTVKPSHTVTSIKRNVIHILVVHMYSVRRKNVKDANQLNSGYNLNVQVCTYNFFLS